MESSWHFHELELALTNLDQASILCIGDLMLDQFVFGEVTRISPEAPIPVLHTISEQNALGGVGNVARNLSSLGVTCHLIGLIGEDGRGRQTAEITASLPHVTPHLVVDKHHTTIFKTRYIAGNQQLLRVDTENIGALSQEAETKIIEMIDKVMRQVDAVILSDYGKGLLSQKVIEVAIDKALQQKKLVIVDPKGKDFTKYRRVDIITPNQKELAQATDMSVSTNEEVVKAAHFLIEKTGIHAVLTTRGREGMTLVQKNKPPVHIPTRAQEVFDVSGAGDTVIATLAAVSALGHPLGMAAEIANFAAGIVVGKVGTATIRKDELAKTLGTQAQNVIDSKIVDAEKAVEIRELWRRKGLKVGFTNGCFDLLHSGHVTLLKKAREQCDRLILGLNSDSSVKRLKGPTRPVQDEHTRSIVLSSLQDVDLVVVFDEDTPLTLVTKLLPTVLIKGKDYTIDKVVGADVVQKAGGQVLLIDLVPNQSTTGIVKRIGNGE